MVARSKDLTAKNSENLATYEVEMIPEPTKMQAWQAAVHSQVLSGPWVAARYICASFRAQKRSLKGVRFSVLYNNTVEWRCSAT